MNPVYTIKETDKGQPFIWIESYTSDQGFPAPQFGFDLPPGTTLERAKEIVLFMKQNLIRFTAME
jgi:hypothetical protein